MDYGKKGLMITKERMGNYNNWIYSRIKPWLKSPVLEVGSGIGVFSDRLIKEYKDVEGSDINKEYIRELKKRYPENNFYCADWGDDKFKPIQRFNSVICLNVLEHIHDDETALKSMYRSLNKEGNLVILVPQYRFLFNSIDRSISHFRRYTKKQLRSKMKKAGFNIISESSFNFTGIIGWFVMGNVLRKKYVNERGVGLMDKILPLIMFIDEKILRRKIGVSIIMVGKRID
jgi:2-polyprenyl-3-methyl-5-hydroxy-6-metoxy-1,4-benzoquinol methylase